MKDTAFNDALDEITSIIKQLTEANQTIEEGTQLKQRAETLIQKNRELLNQGNGTVVHVIKEDGDIREIPLEPYRTGSDDDEHVSDVL